ncbi:MAG: bifunctional folylpolyglutamate synthase/dihydrofolate synthase [Actinobacteria bacterium]|nr:bifunctional folylpolyglutamate synthase/dihydrofolate synthase [Actinomycetota bacterium]
MRIDEALKWLDGHLNLEALARPGRTRTRTPNLHGITALTDLMGGPQHQYPVLHLTGTNGKTSTARLLTDLLVAHGLSVGTLTSPHLERINERIAWNGDPIPDEALAESLSAIAQLEPLVEGDRPSFFDALVAAAFRWFADIAVDAAVIEVGMGGTWDTTNVADGQVAVVTGIGLDHMEYLGPTLEAIARDKSGIVKPRSTLVLGETRPELVEIFAETPAATTWLKGRDFDCEENLPAVGGRSVTLRTPGASYEQVLLTLHGGHQAHNAACALAAAEAFFARPLDEDVVSATFGSATSPGRFEVVGQRPLVVLDGVKNPDGARAAASTLTETFGERRRIVVFGQLRGRESELIARELELGGAHHVIACEPDWARALPADETARAVKAAGCDSVEVIRDIAAAVERALAMAEPDDVVFITGSLYVVGAARAALRGDGDS